jgi:hypothetical protein
LRGLGATNAEAFIEAVSRKLDEGIFQSVVIASTLGRTRLKFAKKLHGKTQIIDFSYRKIPPRIKESITGLSMVVMDNAGLPSVQV